MRTNQGLCSCGAFARAAAHKRVTARDGMVGLLADLVGKVKSGSQQYGQ